MRQRGRDEKSLRSKLAGLICLLGEWLLRIGFRADPDGGAIVVVVVHGCNAWSCSRHLGWTTQARSAADLSREAAEELERHAQVLDEIGGLVGEPPSRL